MKKLKFDRKSPGNEDGHYSGEIEPIDFNEDWQLGFTEGSIIKYLCRHKQKGGRKDIAKVVWYLSVLYARHQAKRFEVLLCMEDKEESQISELDFSKIQKLGKLEDRVFKHLMNFLILGEKNDLVTAMKAARALLAWYDRTDEDVDEFFSHGNEGFKNNIEDQIFIAKPSPQGFPLPRRFHLDNERESRTVKFVIYGKSDKNNLSGQMTKGYFTIGLYPDGTPGEVFIECGKEGSQTRGFADAWAIAISMLLQYGVAPTKIYEKFRFMEFQPSGITRNKTVPFAKSIPDLVIRYMEANFPPTGKSSLSTVTTVDHDTYTGMLEAVVNN